MINRNVYIGSVDILGYRNVESRLKQLPEKESEALMTRTIEHLQQIIDDFMEKSKSIKWIKYGDGFVCYSQYDAAHNLDQIVKQNCRLIALALQASIPLRVAITQNEIHVQNDESGTAITGEGWNILKEIGKSLDWMGGLLFLPNYDRTHQETIRDLIKSTHLVIKQNSVAEVSFNPPFKQELRFSTERTWLLNWQRLLHVSKPQVDNKIRNWWGYIPQYLSLNDSDDVRRKQENAIAFADYCRSLNQAAKLIFFSGVDPRLPIDEIDGFE